MYLLILSTIYLFHSNSVSSHLLMYSSHHSQFLYTPQPVLATQSLFPDHSTQVHLRRPDDKNLYTYNKILLYPIILKIHAQTLPNIKLFLFSSVNSTPNHFPYVSESLLKSTATSNTLPFTTLTNLP